MKPEIPGHASFLWAALRHLLGVSLFALAFTAPFVRAADAVKRTFDVPTADAVVALKQFAEQAGREILYSPDAVRGTKTNAIKGEFTPKGALDRILAGTTLTASESKGGILAVSKVNDPNAPRAAQATASRDRPNPNGDATKTNEEIVLLNPFEVNTSKDTGYTALNSNSITNIRMELDRTPVTADIFDQKFIDDTGNLTVEQLLQTYSAGAGFTGADAASNAGSNAYLDHPSNSFNLLRGLVVPVTSRDGIMRNTSAGPGFNTSFDLERVEVINGPQALLYGAGGAGGVINLVSKQARLGKPAFGSGKFQVDQYGHKLGQFDFGVGNTNIAVRGAILHQEVGDRRINMGGPFDGYYLEFAFRPFRNTTIRLNAEQTTFNWISSTNAKLTAVSSANDTRNGQYLTYLLATNQVNAAADGKASGAGVLFNGKLTWDNVQSYPDWFNSSTTVNERESLSIQTVWSSWLSTNLSMGYDTYTNNKMTPTTTFYSPNNASNPLGVWAVGLASASGPVLGSYAPGYTKGIRFSSVATNNLFNNRAHSQTVIGADFQRTDMWNLQYQYYQADSNWNTIVNPAVTTNNGRTLMPKLYWPVTDGPLHHPLFDPSSRRITYNGVNYVREQVNPVQSALISDNNPLGVTLGGGAHSVSKNIQSGLYATNYTQWFDGKVDTLAGVRLTNALLASISQGTAPPKPSNTKVYFKGEAYNYSFGSTFRLTDWLRPYISLSDSFNTPADFNNDPYGDNAPFAHSLGEEVGIKMTSPNKTISGSIAFYNVVSKNEQYQISSNLQNYINPAGLNGTFGFPSRWIVVDRASKGVQALVTASPSKKLRLRFSAAYTDGTIKNNTAYAQLYNDQFNANKQGQVTYADGTVVYVPPTFSSTTLTTTSATAGALPLTVAMMSAPGSQYYANPVAVTGQINTGSNAAKVLSVIDKVHGPILTGATGLPISALQIDPALSGVNVPGTIVTSQSGDSTTGYPKIGMNVTSVYTLSSGWAKGLEVGGTAILGWGIRNFYYYPTGVTPAAARSLFKMPTLSRFDLIVGYSRRFQRVTWRAQLNVTNLFDRYQRILVPDGSAGWAGPDQVAYTQSPRLFQLSNTISF